MGLVNLPAAPNAERAIGMAMAPSIVQPSPGSWTATCHRNLSARRRGKGNRSHSAVWGLLGRTVGAIRDICVRGNVRTNNAVELFHNILMQMVGRNTPIRGHL